MSSPPTSSRQRGAARRGSGVWRRLAVVLALMTAATSGLAYWALTELTRPEPPPPAAVAWPPQPPEDEVRLERASFTDLPGWLADDTAAAFPPFLASCRRLLRQDAETVLRPEEVGGRVKGWQGVCRRAEDLAGRGADEVRAFFE
ncbi:MAG: hypothetical protein KDD47_26445, partial [Acidobacteria bacterium]|nr:hypothetical protein [Acidobacteriota bacterium]